MHTQGYCSCGMYHKNGQTYTPARSVNDLIGLYAVKPTEYDPITGKPALKTAGLAPEALLAFLFNEGLEVWQHIEDQEKEAFEAYVRKLWLEARSAKQRTALEFFGNMLINLHTDKTPVHGEYAQ